jgi:rRNA maturation endonuclease Nob1
MNSGDIIRIVIIGPVLVFMIIGIVQAVRMHLWKRKARKKCQCHFPLPKKEGEKDICAICGKDL